MCLHYNCSCRRSKGVVQARSVVLVTNLNLHHYERLRQLKARCQCTDYAEKVRSHAPSVGRLGDQRSESSTIRDFSIEFTAYLCPLRESSLQIDSGETLSCSSRILPFRSAFLLTLRELVLNRRRCIPLSIFRFCRVFIDTSFKAGQTAVNAPIGPAVIHQARPSIRYFCTSSCTNIRNHCSGRLGDPV